MSTSNNVKSISDTISIYSDSTSRGDLSENREPQPSVKAKSNVWQYFGLLATTNGDFIEKDEKKRTEVFCKLCLKRINHQGSIYHKYDGTHTMQPSYWEHESEIQVGDPGLKFKHF